MWRLAAIGLMVVVALLVGYLISDVQIGGMHIIKTPALSDVSYSDFVTIILTVFGVIVAIASIALAAAGVIGWNSIEGKAIGTAERVTSTNINDPDSTIHRLIKEAIANPDSPLHQTLKAEAQRVMFEGVLDVDEHEDDVLSEGGQNDAQ